MRCLRSTVKQFLGFLKFKPEIRHLSFFGQIIKSILQSVNCEEELTNELQNLVKLYYGKIAKFAQCCKISKRIIKIGQITEKLKNTFIWPFLI